MRKISNPRQSISSVLHCAQYTYCFFPSKEPDSSICRSPMSNSHVQAAKGIAEDIAHLCCVPDDWRLQISDLAEWPLPTFCAKPLRRNPRLASHFTISRRISRFTHAMFEQTAIAQLVAYGNCVAVQAVTGGQHDSHQSSI